MEIIRLVTLLPIYTILAFNALKGKNNLKNFHGCSTHLNVSMIYYNISSKNRFENGKSGLWTQQANMVNNMSEFGNHINLLQLY